MTDAASGLDVPVTEMVQAFREWVERALASDKPSWTGALHDEGTHSHHDVAEAAARALEALETPPPPAPGAADDPRALASAREAARAVRALASINEVGIDFIGAAIAALEEAEQTREVSEVGRAAAREAARRFVESGHRALSRSFGELATLLDVVHTRAA